MLAHFLDGSRELYTTASPCWNCFKLIANSGIKRIFFGEFYRDERSREVAAEVGIATLVRVSPDTDAEYQVDQGPWLPVQSGGTITLELRTQKIDNLS